MDIGFQRKRTATHKRETTALAGLLATLAARQAGSPTARVVAAGRGALDRQASDQPRSETFSTGLQADDQRRSSSFHPAVSTAVLSLRQPS